MKQQFN